MAAKKTRVVKSKGKPGIRVTSLSPQKVTALRKKGVPPKVIRSIDRRAGKK